jgi:outer membrane protein assembly factor BamB
MSNIPKTKRSLILYLGLVFLALVLTGCSGGLLGNANWPGISVDEDNVYISLGQFVHAVDAESGDEVCRFPEESERNVNFFAPPMPTDQNLVIVGDFNGMIYAFDRSDNCRERWSEQVSDDFIIGGPVVFDDTVLVPSADGTLYALRFDTTSARVTWIFETQSALWSSPLVSDGVIYQSSMDHHLYAINAQNGNLIWEEDLGAALLDTPTETENSLLVGTFGNQLLALDKARGAQIWSFDTEAWVYGNPLVLDEVAYFGDVDGNIYFVNVNSGREVRDSVKLDGAVTASPVASEELIYFATEAGTIYARTPADFSPEWEEEVGGGVFVEPILWNDSLFLSVISEETPLLSIRADTSATKWPFLPAEE